MTAVLEKNIERHSDGHARWNMVNQANELIVAHLNSVAGEAIYGAIENIWPHTQQRQSGIIPINHILRYAVSDQQFEVGQPLSIDTTVQLVAQPSNDGTFRRVHLHAICHIHGDSAQPAGTADYWVALTKPFADPSERRLTAIPDPLAHLAMHAYEESDAPLEDIDTYRLLTPETRHSDQDTFHLNQTDVNHHVNTIVYLDMAQDRVASLNHKSGQDISDMRFRTLDVFYRKPFTAGQLYQLETDLDRSSGSFQSAVRFMHTTDGESDQRISVGLLLGGVFV